MDEALKILLRRYAGSNDPDLAVALTESLLRRVDPNLTIYYFIYCRPNNETTNPSDLLVSSLNNIESFATFDLESGINYICQVALGDIRSHGRNRGSNRIFAAQILPGTPYDLVNEIFQAIEKARKLLEPYV